MPEQTKFVSVDQLPDDPTAMPPPHWRGGGAWFQLDDALDALVDYLHDLLPVHADAKLNLATVTLRFADDVESEEAREAFQDVYEPVWEVEHRITLKSELAILMAAIHAEELINRFCVYNLPKELVESVERLSPAEKLVAAASHLGHSQVRSGAAYAAIAGLLQWRNAFAHGHCVDRPTKTLRHNHLITPDRYLHLPETIATVIQHITGYDRLLKFLSTASVNPYTKTPVDGAPFTLHIEHIKCFVFSGPPESYDVDLENDDA